MSSACSLRESREMASACTVDQDKSIVSQRDPVSPVVREGDAHLSFRSPSSPYKPHNRHYRSERHKDSRYTQPNYDFLQVAFPVSDARERMMHRSHSPFLCYPCAYPTEAVLAFSTSGPPKPYALAPL